MSQPTSAFSPETKELIRLRANNRCEMCGMAGSQWHFHHRRPRAMGGTSRDETSDCSNGLMLHPQCHHKIEMSRKIARDKGWIVTQQDDPEIVPVKLWDGWKLLQRDGSINDASPRCA